jgi:predicted 3-demethylubiquinone-9 3-methyltransferase (glyoxalase superfamily)
MISLCLWMDNEAEEAAKFYTSLFKKSKIKETANYLVDTPSNKPIGSVMTVTFAIEGQEFMALNGGEFFRMNPSISVAVQCDDEKEIERLFNKLSFKGSALMPLSDYGFSKKFGWVQDRFGLSWQLNLPFKKSRQKIHPFLMFTQKVCGKAEEAMKHYMSVFSKSKITEIVRHGKGGPDKEGTVAHAVFSLMGQEFMASDSNGPHKFTFNEGVSLMVPCKDQKEMDYFYSKLSAVPEAEVCGWLKDKYGVSWQLIPKDLGIWMTGKNAKQVMAAVMGMKRLDLKELQRVAKGQS